MACTGGLYECDSLASLVLGRHRLHNEREDRVDKSLVDVGYGCQKLIVLRV